MKQIITALILLGVIGCGGPKGSTWLIRTANGEVTVSQAGDAWNGLNPDAMRGFMSGNNPVGGFVSTLGHKLLIISEISNDEYLYSNKVQAVRECWLRNTAYLACTDSLESEIRASVTDEDILFFKQLIGTIVWYTSPDGVRRGPERLPDLEWELAFAFDTMSPGRSVSLAGEVFVLDSAVTSPDSMIQITLADTARVNAFALASLTEKRLSAKLDSIGTAVLGTLELDSALVNTYCSARNTLEDETVLAFWEEGVLTASDMDGIVALTSMGQPVAPESSLWVYHNLKNHAKLTAVCSMFSEIHPEAFSAITEQSNDFAKGYAGDLLFSEAVLSAVELTDEMIMEAYESLDSIPTVPEMRIFESVMLSAEDIDSAFSAACEGANPEDFEYPGYTRFLTPGSEHLSRPVTASELPGNMGTILFMTEEGNTDWQRPIEVQEGLFVMFRLDSIIMPRPAAFQEMEAVLRANLSARISEQITMEWLRSLEEAHELEINSGILKDLPADPSLWSNL